MLTRSPTWSSSEGELDPETERIAKAALVVVARIESFQGPLPHPDHLTKYEEVLPGAAERVFTMAEREQAHRHGVDDTAIAVEKDLGTRGQHYGLIVTGIVGAVILGSLNQPIPSAFLGGSSLIGLVALFIKRPSEDDSSKGVKGEGEDQERK